MLPGELPSVRYAQLKNEPELQQLDPALQQLVTRMINHQAVDRLSSFSEVDELLEQLQQELPAKAQLQRGKGFNWKLFLALALLFNLVMIAVIFLF